MYSVYILKSLKDGKLYVGCTTDITKRINEHNNGRVNSTKYRRPLITIHIERFDNKTEAFNRERFLKSLWGAKTKKRIEDDWAKSTRNAS